jgi:hypothetical protein
MSPTPGSAEAAVEVGVAQPAVASNRTTGDLRGGRAWLGADLDDAAVGRLGGAVRGAGSRRCAPTLGYVAWALSFVPAFALMLPRGPGSVFDRARPQSLHNH